MISVLRQLRNENGDSCNFRSGDSNPHGELLIDKVWKNEIYKK